MKIQNHLQTKLQNAAHNLCLAITYITLALWENASEEEKPFIETMTCAAIVPALDDREVLSEDGFVNNAELLIKRATNFDYSVVKQDIKSLKDLPENVYAAVRFDYNGKSHWVGVYNREVIYNSLEFSNCFSYGKPVTARIMRKK